MRWSDGSRVPRTRATAEFRATAQTISLRRRIDIVLITFVVASVATLALLSFIGIEAADQRGWLDPEAIRPVDDERLRINIRDDLADRPLLDAVLHAPDRKIYIAQAGKTVHAYDPDTHLWTTDQPLRDDPALQSDLVRLRSGCGRDPGQPGDDCPDSDSIWALSEQGGLVRRSGDDWQVVISDLAWIGRRGKPVQNADLTAAAVSSDGRWLVLGSREDGVGLYDITRRVWAPAPATTAEGHPAAVTHIVWWNTLFWIGGPDGLVALDPMGRQLQFTQVVERGAPILDLDAEADGLWVLERRGCAEGDDTCLWLGKVRSLQEPAAPLIDERNHFAGLNLESLVFAQDWDQRLVVAGSSGIYAYDPLLHSWERRFDKPVAQTLSLPTGDGFYFDFPGGAGVIQGQRFQTWNVPDGPITKLLYGRDTNDVLALTEKGSLFALGTGQDATPVFQVTGTTLDPARFTTAVDLDDTVLFLGPDGMLLNGLASRSYRDIPKAELPLWLQDGAVRAFRAGDHVYFLAEQEQQLVAYPVGARDLTTHAAYTGTLHEIRSLSVPGPVERLWNWPGAGLGALGADGSVYAITPSAIEQHTGSPQPDLDGVRLLDATAQGTDLIVATKAGLRRYDGTSRAWVEQSQPPHTVVELDSFDGQLIGRTDQNELATIDASPEVVIGEQDGFQIGDAAFSDARLNGSRLFLGGSGRIEEYSTQDRRIDQHWDLPGEDAVRIKGVVNGLPLAQTGETATLGADAIDPQAGPVIATAAAGNTIWTVRRDGEQRYLKGYTGAAAQCLFRAPWTPANATQIQDARVLPDGSIAVSTGGGLLWYVPAARSWYRGPDGLGSARGRLYLLGQHLALTEPQPDGLQLTLIALDSINIPDSCSTDAVQLQATMSKVLAATFDEGTGRAAWINPDGSVVEWQAGQQRELLASAGGGPNRADLRRVFSRPDYLLLSTDDQLWHYDLASHRWSSISLEFGSAPGPLADINVELSGSEETVVARTTAGIWYLGNFVPPVASIQMQQLLAPPQSTFNAPASALLDVQGTISGTWTFVLQDRLKYYDGATRRWVTEATFPTNDATRSLQRALDRSIVVANNGKTWWIARQAGQMPTQFVPFDLKTGETTALDIDGGVWRLTSGGEVLACIQQETDYRCEARTSPPMLLDAGQVRMAFEWEGVLLFDTTAGLRAFDPARGTEIQLPAEVGLQGPLVARVYSGRLFLHSGSTLVELVMGADRVIQARRWDGISHMIYDQQGTPWARFAGGWQRWEDQEWRSPVLPDGRTAAEAGIALFAVEGIAPSAFGGDGLLISWTPDAVTETLDIPATIDRRQVDLIIRGAQDDWWIRTGRSVAHVRRDTCAVPAVATPTASATLTATGTLTPTIVPLPTPVPQPCLSVAGTVDLPAAYAGPGAPAEARSGAGWLELVRSSGETTRVTRESSGRYTTAITQANATIPAGLRADEWPQLRAFHTQLGDGRMAFDPVTQLVSNQQGELTAVRPSRTIPLGARGVTRLVQPPALDAGWLRWDRAATGFVVAGVNGPLNIPRDQFVVDGQLIFEPVEAVLAAEPTVVHVANRYGLWTYRQTTTGLAGATLTYRPLDLATPIGAAHGRFLLPNGDLPPDASAITPAVQQESFQSGDMEIVEQVRSRTISAHFTRAGAQVDALSDAGFVWDRGRRGIAFGSGSLFVQSETGIHPVAGFAGFDPGPSPDATREGQLRSENGSGVLLLHGTTWYRLNQAAWTIESVNPELNRSLVDDSTWIWQLRNGQVDIQLKGTPHAFSYGADSRGFSFSSDRMLAATASDNKLFVVSEAFLEIADRADELATLSAPRQAPLPTDRLEDMVLPDGSAVLFHYSGSSVSRWDAGAQRFTPVGQAEAPETTWRLVESARLRLTRQAGHVVKDVRLDIVQGGDRWVTFALVDRRFPFDVVTSIAVDGDELLVASGAGLQIYSGDLSLELDQIDRLYDLEPTAPAPTRVERVGRPLDDPELIMARTASACFERRGRGAFTACANAGLLDRRLRVASELWQWTIDPAQNLQGVYRTRDGAASTMAATIAQGRFPHDRIVDVAVCGGRAYSLWQDGWITVYGGTTIALATGLANDALPAIAPRRFVCVERDLPIEGSTVPDGIYVEAGDGHFLKGTATGWQDVSDGLAAAALSERLVRPPLIEQGHVRLLPADADGGLIFEQQATNGQWHPLPWIGNRVAVDQWSEVIVIQDQLWAATPAGLVSFVRSQGRSAVLDPQTLTVVREPPAGDGICGITDIRLDGADTLVRCEAASDQVYRGQLAVGRDRGIFSRITGIDPFAEQTLIAAQPDGFWDWKLTGRAGGSRGAVIARRYDEEVQLSGGRFDFDVLSSLTLFYDGQVEISSEQAGLFEIPRNSLHLREWRRPKVTTIMANDVNHVGVARLEQEDFLCLRHVDGTTVRVSRSGEAEQTICRQFLGDDGLWYYEQEQQTLRVTTPGEGGTGTRRLVDGRFADDRLIGLPVAGRDQNGHYYLVPTEAGVVRLDPTLTKTGVHVGTFDGLPGEQTPATLFMWDAGTPVYVGAGRLYGLTMPRQPVMDLALNLPGDAIVEGIEEDAYSYLRLRWMSGDEQHWTLMDREGRQASAHDTAVVDLGELQRYQSRHFAWGDPSSSAQAIVGRDRLDFLWPQPDRPYTLAYPGPIEMVTAIRHGNRLLLIGSQELFELNLEAVLPIAMSANGAP